MAKVVCVLYDDPVDGYPKTYPRDDLPRIDHYPDGQTLPTPKSIDFKPGTLLGSVSGELGLRKYLESNGHTLVVTSDKDGAGSVLDRELPDAEIVISQPFWPAYMTTARFAKAPKLKLVITAGIGSDHTDLQAAIDHGVTVAEVTYSNSISVAEHVVMMILSLVRNYIPSYQWVVRGGWNIADCAARSYDVEGMHAGTVAAGRIGLAVLRRLKPFDMHLHYYDRHRLPAAVEKELNVAWHPSVEDMVKVCDVVTINCPLYPETVNLFDATLISKMKRGAYIVDTARAKICDRDAIVRALEIGQLAGYAGDVWFPQPPPKDHPWRTMPHHGMTPHISGTSLSAQARYSAGTREILECYFEGRPIRDEYLIVDKGRLAGAGAHSYSAGNATGGSEEAAKFKKGA
ncbi:MAG: NAD-dependent formate dehydrogenase [Methylocella sp.]